MKTYRFREDDEPKALLAKLNDFARAVSDYMSGQITVREHLAQEFVEAAFTGPAATLSFAVDSTVEPQGVVLVYLRNTATNAAIALTDTFAWTFSGATGTGQIVTTSFSGLSAGTYRARLLVIRE